MAEAWYAAFGLLALLTGANSVLLIAMMRQVGVLHQRVPPVGPGSVGPEPGRTFQRLDLLPVPGATMDGFGTSRVTVLAYVTPGCSLCDRIPGFLKAYRATASGDERTLVSFALATDAPEPEAQRFREQHDVSLPILRHPHLRDHYELTAIGAPYLLALTDQDGVGEEQLLLAGGIINTLEQLEELMAIALEEYARFTDEQDSRSETPAQPSHGDAR